MDRGFEWLGMSPNRDRVILHRFKGDFPIRADYTKDWKKKNEKFIARAAVLDVETNSLSHTVGSIIEIGIRFFLYDERNGDLVSVEEEYRSFQDPGKALEENITRLTGISDKDVQGQSIDWHRVDTLLEDAQFIIAHNAAFDRPFIDAKSSVSRKKIWACSLSQIDWAKRNYPSRKLENLSIYHGFFVSSHRALEDADATLFLLSHTYSSEQHSYLQELLQNAQKPMVRIIAKGASFDTRNYLKGRGYHWNADMRFWHRTISCNDVKTECKWMEKNIYKGDFQGIVQDIFPQDNFKNMQKV